MAGMKTFFCRWAVLICVLLSTAFVWDCADAVHGTDVKQSEAVLISVGQSIVTTLDFNRAFEIAKAAYSDFAQMDAGIQRQIQMQVLNQLKEELILRERARELQISISDQELQQAVAEIRNDFPAREFEDSLLKQAISYQLWVDRLRMRLLMQKVVAQELLGQLAITQEEIAAYYQANFGAESARATIQADRQTDDQAEIRTRARPDMEKMLQNLRRAKTEAAYPDWIKKLQEKYTVEVNRTQWNRLVGS